MSACVNIYGHWKGRATIVDTCNARIIAMAPMCSSLASLKSWMTQQISLSVNNTGLTHHLQHIMFLLLRAAIEAPRFQRKHALSLAKSLKRNGEQVSIPIQEWLAKKHALSLAKQLHQIGNPNPIESE